MILHTKVLEDGTRLVCGTTPWAKNLPIIYDHEQSMLLIGPGDPVPARVKEVMNEIAKSKVNNLQARETDFGLLKVLKDVFDVNYQCEECGEWAGSLIETPHPDINVTQYLCAVCYGHELYEAIAAMGLLGTFAYTATSSRVKFLKEGLSVSYGHDILTALHSLKKKGRAPRSLGKLIKLLEGEIEQTPLV